ncbi:SusC/RagA family TonB-linked outer membrane protein [Pseudobacter ginsenosidimutans]|uniref:TonB-linked SusC/RagA family outer membrane protein n=1 Tax=Pseudobacter ginsenosidimutans TaxID=661488 RepID=A0A4V2F174_9BACT|nr:SusC/RagA family TonB-linked outer membrane protein [Pseudobacter ginsenosidimutans]QEC40640.1 SusC/RagA family TonB-linked outer membrane protein [Pseudobacter ginsenosidimutans]RZS72641.1 TonB-linked SusC/RagA family outer membrane protein [Pseudobacter ginsenosidimutans]
MQKTAFCIRDVVAFSNPVAPPGIERSRHRLIQKPILIAMKLTALLLLIGSLHLCAATHSQTITYEGKDVPLSKLFSVIKQQTGFGVFGNARLLKNTHRVSIVANNMPLQEFLHIAFSNQPLTYRILDKTIVLYSKEDEAGALSEGIQPAPVVIEEPEPEADPVKGRVLAEDGKPLSGVSVRVKGTSIGVSSDDLGNFSIDAKEKQTLLFSYIGMESQEFKIIDPSKPVRIVLKTSEAAMKDVVVTGYSNLKKESFTGNSVRVDREQILKVSNRNVIDVLQVFDPSFRIEMNNIMGSDPNTMPKFYIRGRSGIGVKALDNIDVSQAALTNNPNLPIFIMDGFEVTAERVYDFDPTRIKSITILKDAAATAIYGSRAANGVVVIETVAPMPGKIRVNYNFVSTLTLPDVSDYNLMNASEKLEAEKLAGFFESDNPNQMGQLHNEYIKKNNQILRGINTDWISQPLTNEFSQKHALSFDGGTNEIRFNALLRYDKQNGVMKKSSRERMGAGFVFEYRTTKFQVRNDINYDVVKATNSPYGVFSDYTWKAPYDEMVDRNGNYLFQTNLWHSGSSELNLLNPLYEVHNTKNFDRTGYNNLVNNLSLVYRILPKLNLRGQLAITKNTDESEKFTDPVSGRYLTGYGLNQSEIGELRLNRIERTAIATKLFANYMNRIGMHDMNFSAGINTDEVKSTGEQSTYTGFPSGSQNSPAFAAKIALKPGFSDNHTRNFGSFIALNYSFNEIYLADVSARLDGSSEFGTEKRIAPFWSLGAGLNIHKYKFLRDHKIISRLRVTANIGQLGKTNFPPYAAKDMFALRNDWYRTGVGATLMGLGNPLLTWEKTRTKDLIFDVGLLNDRFNFNINFYNKETIDLVNDVDLPSSSGFSKYKDNIGRILNRGVEIQLRADVYKTKDVIIAVYGNLGHNKNKILDISQSLKEYNKRVDAQYDGYNQWSSTDPSKKDQFSRAHTKYVPGGSLTSIFGMRSLGINPMDGKEIFLKADGTVTYDWEAAEQVIIGDLAPDITGAFGLNISYKGFTLFTSCLYESGGQQYNETLRDKVETVDLYNRNTDRRVLQQRWIKPGDITALKDIKERNMATRPTSRFIQDYNVITINSLSLGYQFRPDMLKRFGLSMLRAQLSTNNLATISTVKQERGLSYPFARSFDFSLTVGL